MRLPDVPGHWRTLRPHVRHGLMPYRPSRPTAWRTVLLDADRGRVRLSGALREAPGSRDLIVLVHGLGGSSRSLACLRGAEIFEDAGVSTLSVSLRGADYSGDDFYNVALTADLHATLASPALAAYERIFVLGYSMGGYVALHLAAEPRDPRLCAVAAICTPLDLSAAQKHIDAPRALFYRRYLLHGLVSIYEHVAARRTVPTSFDEVRRVRTMHDWDRLTIAPRYGYRSPEHYYRELSVVPRLSQLQVPSLLVAAVDDPIIPPSTIEPFTPGAAGRGVRAGAAPFTVRWVHRAGHLAFRRDLDLGYGATPGLEEQVHAWFQRAACGRAAARRAAAIPRQAGGRLMRAWRPG